jgi:hypothetical protein
MALVGVQLSMADGVYVRVAEQYLIDTYNTAYVDGTVPIAIGAPTDRAGSCASS